VIALPALSALIALACAAVVGRDLYHRPKPDRVAWLIAFALFAVAAATEVIGEAAGWDTLTVRIYYLTGAVLVVGYLALGQLYLVTPGKIGRVAPGAALLVTALAVSTVWGAPVDQARLDADGWDAITRTTGLTLLTVGVNSVGTLILIGGLIYSAVRFRQLGTMRNRMLGCLLIAGGTLAVAAGGTLTRLGSDQFLYIAMSVGIAMIFCGYLWTKVPDGAAFRPVRSKARQSAQPGLSRSPGIAFIEQMLATRSDIDLAELCREWSVPARAVDAFNRAEARRVWAFRVRLGSLAQAQFDDRPASLRLQLTELYFDVMTGDIGLLDRAPVGWHGGRDDESAVRTGTASVD